MENWTKLDQENLLKFLSHIFKKSDIVEELTCLVLNNDAASGNCIFRPLRGKSEPCTNIADVPYGYCKKHLKTVQAKAAKEKWDLLTQPPKVEEPVKTEPVKVEPIKTEQVKTEPVKAEPPKVTEPVKATDDEPQSTPIDIEYVPPIEKAPERKIPKKEFVRKNKWGNYEHEASHIVFDVKTKSAYGYQYPNGDVYSLGPEQVEYCIKNGWNYILPEAKLVDDDGEQSEEERELDFGSDHSDRSDRSTDSDRLVGSGEIEDEYSGEIVEYD